MKKNADKEFDNLFKHGLEDPVYEPGYLEDDWDALENMLDKSKKRTGLIFWMPILSSAAAILIFFGWWLFAKPVTPDNHVQQQQALVTTKPKKNVGTDKIADNKNTNDEVNAAAPSKEVKGTPQVQANGTLPGGSFSNKGLASNITRSGKRSNNMSNIDMSSNYSKKDNNSINERKDSKQIASNGQPTTTYNVLNPAATMLVAVNGGLLKDNINEANESTASTPVEAKDIVRARYRPDPTKAESGVTKLGFVKRPQLALTFLGASELNGANSLGDGKSGTNVGLMFSAGIFSKLTVSTGANYSVKPYNTDIASYHTSYKFKTNPIAIEADCRVLDIPINFDYQLYNKHKNKFSVGTGLSSYIMLHESYNYYYADPATKGPTAFTVPGQGKYFFGVMNLQATYQRQINSKVGISIEPYMKLPLKNIGYSQIKLQTTGVAVGLNWNLNSLTKP